MKDRLENNYIHGPPSVLESKTNTGITLSYRWTTPDRRNIFVYLTFLKKHTKEHETVYVAHANLDSSEVKGQGKYIWQFVKEELSRLAISGLSNSGSHIIILHEMTPNEHSIRLVESDTDYQARDGKYYRIYS